MGKLLISLALVFLLLNTLVFSTIEDEDEDGVPDFRDECSGSQTTKVDWFGCSCTEKTQPTCEGQWCCIDDGNPGTVYCGEIGPRPFCNVLPQSMGIFKKIKEVVKEILEDVVEKVTSTPAAQRKQVEGQQQKQECERKQQNPTSCNPPSSSSRKQGSDPCAPIATYGFDEITYSLPPGCTCSNSLPETHHLSCNYNINNMIQI